MQWWLKYQVILDHGVTHLTNWTPEEFPVIFTRVACPNQNIKNVGRLFRGEVTKSKALFINFFQSFSYLMGVAAAELQLWFSLPNQCFDDEKSGNYGNVGN